jgi:DNA uptake protein ComE-like DNA-binding protein
MAREEISNTGCQPVLWTPSQRRTLLVLILIFILVLMFKAITNRQYIADPQPTQPPLASELADRLDPNTATADELIILPQLGEKRAAEIIAFRQRQLRRNPTTVPFRRPEDLLQITGIGAAMLETLRPHLTFPTTAPAGL